LRRTEGSLWALWPALLALVLAVLVVLLMPDTAARRTSRIDLSASGIRETYLVFSRSQPDRCRVVDRRDSTLRRFDGTPGRGWDCLRIPPSANLREAEAWMVQSKKRDRGTAFFVRVERVGDWSYPYLYGFVRERYGALDLPLVEWTQLYVNRVYRGLHLRVALPFDLRRKDGGSGTLRELLVASGGRVAGLDTRFNESDVLLARRRMIGRVTLELAAPELVWLTSLAPLGGASLLISNEPPYVASFLPLPVSLSALFASLHGRMPKPVEGTSMLELLGVVAGAGDPRLDGPLSAGELRELEDGFGAYALALQKALQASAQLDRSLPRLRGMLRERQAAARNLGLQLEAL